MNFDKLKKAILQSKFGRIARIAKRMLLLQRPMFRLTAPESKLAHSLLDGLRGIEIGPSTHNPFGLDTRNVGHHDPVYEQEQRSLTGSFAHIHIEANADSIPLPDDSEDFVLSSHVIEHCPNFVKAMLEWYRIIKPGGYLYMITPLRDASPADRDRPLTTWDHMVADFRNDMTAEKEPEAGVFGHCHYHVFSIESMQDFITKIFGDRLQLVASQERDDKIGNGFTLVYKKSLVTKSGTWVRNFRL
jgi:SAM-dependent methyltransferase